jgi:hypothetical protein
MNKHGRQIKKIIKYLTDIYNKEDLSSVNQDLFLSKPELDKLLDKYYLQFENSDEQNKAVAHNLEILDKLSFNNNEEGYKLYKDLTRESNLNLSKEEHLKYASSIYYQLKDSFIGKLKEDGIDVSYNPYPKIFKSGTVYNKFLAYTENHIIDPYLDYSYLKKRLEHDGLIHRTKDNEFMRMVYKENNLISEKRYEDYLIKGKLLSLNKSSSVQRENNFNNLFL